MKVFAAVVETGSFAAAADRLDVSRAMVSKYVAHLEQHLGARLLQRTTRKLALTESGAAYYDRCAQLLIDLAEAEESAASLTAAPRGTLRLTVPVSFGIRHIRPVLSQYLKQYPEVKVDLIVTDRYVDLIEEGIDLAVRIGSLPESGLIARKLASDRLVLCGAPEYLKRHGVPRTPADLMRFDCLSYSYAASGEEWKMVGPDGPHAVKVSGSLRATNADLLILACLDGLGLTRQPLFLVGEDIRSGRLVQVLPEYEFPELGIHAVYLSRKHVSAKVRTFVDLLATALAMKSEW